MNELFIYLIKAALINAVILAFYFFALRNGNKFGLMRFVLILAMVLPLLLPLIPVNLSHQEHTALPVYVIQIPEVGFVSNEILPKETSTNLPPIPVLLYYLITLVLLGRVIYSILTIVRKRMQSVRKLTTYGHVLVSKDNIGTFSFFNWVFISPADLALPRVDLLLRHEFLHAKAGHSLDQLLAGIFRSVLWFSPLAHKMSKLLSEVHEYQADEAVLKLEVNSIEYSNMLLIYSSKSPFEISNPFSVHIKNRIIMINKSKSISFSHTRLITGSCIAAFLLVLTVMICPVTGNNTMNDELFKGMSTLLSAQQDTSTIYTRVDKAPQFPGGENARMQYFQKAIVYPEQAKKKRIEGIVHVSFIIEKDGSVTNIKPLRSVDPLLDKAAVEAIKGMPAWIPGAVIDKTVSSKNDKLEKYKKVRTQYTLPIKFELTKDVIKKTEQIEKTEKPEKTEEIRGTQSEEREAFQVVDQQPEFPGGFEAMATYMKKNTNYTEEAKKKKTEGVIYVGYVVEADGSISNVKVLRGNGSELEKIAVKAIKNMPNWIPGKKDGKNVPVQLTMPVKFSLQEK